MKQDDIVCSVWCIAYNQVAFIRECLEGIVSQETEFTFEAIVHDDASTDGTTEIIREYSERYPHIIKPIFETENQYSKGTLVQIREESCRGKYVALCEGDDYWTDSHKLQKQIDYLEHHSECSMIHTAFSFYYQDKALKEENYNISERIASVEAKASQYISYILKGNFYRIQTCSVVYRLSSYDKIKNIFIT